MYKPLNTRTVWRYCVLVLAFLGLFYMPSYAQLAAQDTVCTGDVVTYNVPTSSGSSFVWSVVGGTSLPTMPNEIIVTWGAAGTGFVDVVIDATTSQHTDVTIGGKPNPMIVSGANVLCSDTTVVAVGDEFEPVKPGTAGEYDRFDPLVCITVCDSSTVSYYTAYTAGNSYTWQLTGDIVSSTTNANGDSITIEWGGVSTGSVQVTETTAFGCTDSSAFCIEIIESPEARLFPQNPVVAGAINLCLNQYANFCDSSLGDDLNTWAVNYGDGSSPQFYTSSPLCGLSHQYTSPGTYTVEMVVTNDCGCSDTTNIDVIVDSMPGATIVCPSVVCAYDKAEYCTPDGCGMNGWTVTGGVIIAANGPDSTCITVQWGNGSSGPGLVTLDAGACSGLCATPTTVQVPIVPDGYTVDGPEIVCRNTFATYSVPKIPGATYEWIIPFELQTTSTELAPNVWEIGFPCNVAHAGSYSITVIIDHPFLGCTGKATLDIKVLDELIIGLLDDPVICVGEDLNFQALLDPGCLSFSGTLADWTIIDPSGVESALLGDDLGSFNFTFNAPGIYTVVARPAAPNTTCNDIATMNIQVVAPPAPPSLTGPTPVCIGSTHNYFVSPFDPGLGYIWGVNNGAFLGSNFGSPVTVTWDGSPAGDYGMYAVARTLGSPSCISDTAFLPVDTVPPIQIIGPDTVCPNGTYTFTTTLAGSVFYDWTIRDPLVASVISGIGTQSVQVEFTNTGGSTWLVLNIPDCNNFIDSIEIFVQPLTPPATVHDTICDGDILNLSVVGSMPSWYSDFGGFIVSAPSIPVTMQGLYTVQYKDGNGCMTSATTDVRVLETPVAFIGTLDPNVFPCDSSLFTSIDLVATDGSVAGDPYQFQWKLNGIDIAGATSSTYTGTAFGAYTVCVTANGCTENSNQIEILVPCDSCVTIETISASYVPPMCNPITVTGTTSGGVVNPQWNFNDLTPVVPGVVGGVSTVTHEFAEAGIYLIEYSALAPSIVPGDTCAIEAEFNVEIPVVADWEFVRGCPGMPTQFFDLSTKTPSTTIFDYTWNFGDSNFGSGMSPTHSYASSGTYIVTMCASAVNPSTGDTCVSCKTDTIDVTPVSAAFTMSPNPACENQPVSFTPGSDPAIIFWEWDYDDGSSSLAQFPDHAFTPSGTFNVQLIVTDVAGCMDTVTQSLVVTPAPTPGDITGDTAICSGTTSTLTAPGPAGSLWLWNTGETTQSITVSLAGDYLVQVTTPDSCIYFTDPYTVSVIQPPIVLFFEDTLRFCEGEPFIVAPNILNPPCPFGSPGCTYVWFNDAGGTGVNSPTYPVSFAPAVPDSNGTYTLAHLDFNTGCVGQDSIEVIVYPAVAAPVITVSGPSPLCSGVDRTLSIVSPDPTASYSWSNTQTGTSINVNQPGNYSVICTSVNGCTKQSNTITIHPLPDVSCVLTGCFEFPCETDSVVIPGPLGFSAYNWLEVDPITGACTLAPGPTATTQNYTTYVGGQFKLELTSADGCVDTAAVIDIMIEQCQCDGSTVFANAVLDSLGNIGDSCCYTIGLQNTYEPDYFTSVMFTSTNADLDYTFGPAGYTLGAFGTNTVTALPPGGFVAEASIDSVVTLCFSNNTTDSVELIVCWFDSTGAVCYDTLMLFCPPDPSCLTLLNDTIYCNEGIITMEFYVENHSDSTMHSVAINTGTQPVVVDPDPVVIPALAPGAIYGPIVLTLDSLGIPPGDSLCITLTAHNAADPDSATWCCSDAIPYYFTIPDCPPCDSITVSATASGGGCCFNLDIANPTSFEFDGLITEVITPGSTVSSVSATGSGWTIGLSGSMTAVTWTMPGSYIPHSTTLPEMCLSGTSATQTMLVTWFSIDGKGDTLTCTDTVTVQCANECVGILTDSLYCDSAGYHYTFELYNNTGTDINQFDFINLTPTGAAVPAMPISTTIVDGATATYTVDLTGVVYGDTMCFNVRATDQAGNMDVLNCCVSDSLYCLPMPFCDTCDIAIVPSGPTTFCETDSVILCVADCCTDSVAAYKWDGPGLVFGHNDPCIVAVNAGTYSVTVTCASGLVQSTSIDVVVHAPPAVSATAPSMVCVDDAPFAPVVSPTGGTFSGTGYDPVTGILDPAAVGAGVYPFVYTYTDPNTGCAGSAFGSVTVNALPTVALPDQAVCTNTSPYVVPHTPPGGTFSALPGLSPLSGLWNPSVTGAGVFAVTYTYTDLTTGCTNSATATYTVSDAPVVNIVDQVVCSNELPYFVLHTPFGGTFSSVPGLDPATGEFDPSVPAPGVYPYTYTVTDSLGCSGTDSATITVNAAPVVSISNQVVCSNDLPYSLAHSPLGGTFSFVPGLDPATGSFDPSVPAPGVYPYSYTFTDSTTGCTDSAFAIIRVIAAPQVSVVDQERCNNDLPYSLFRSPPGGTFSFVPGLDPVTGGFDPSVPAPGVYPYTYTYTDPGTGCSGTASATITVNAVPRCLINVAPDDTGWVGLTNTIYTNYGAQCVILTAPAGYSYMWTGGATAQTITVCPTVTTTYTLQVSDSLGCSSRCTVTICVLPGCVRNGIPSVIMCRRDSVTGAQAQGCITPAVVPIILGFNGSFGDVEFFLGPCDNPCIDTTQVSPNPNASVQGPSAPIERDVARFMDPKWDTGAAAREASAKTADRLAASGVVLRAQPNPFRNRTEVRFSVTEAQDITLEVFSITGERVAVLHRGPATANTVHSFNLEAADMAPGMYMSRLTKANGTVVFDKLILLGR